VASRAKNGRDLALDVLFRVETQGAFASAALRAAFDASPGLDGRERGLATELVYGVLRRRAQLDKAIAGRGRRLKDLDPPLHDPLRLGAYQILFLDRVPAHAAVDAAVEHAKARRGKPGASLVNAVLRKLADTPPAERIPSPPPLETDPVAHVAQVGSVGRPIAARWVEDLGPRPALELALAQLELPPLVLRTNRLRAQRAEVLEAVHGTEGAHPLAVHLPERGGLLPAELDVVLDGRASHQDEASMWIVDLLDPRPGERVLDLCAAPGGKTTAIAERMDDRGEVIAHDRTPKKLALVERAAERLGLSSVRIEPVAPDAGLVCDRVLVDAPCSGLGTLRRHPELRWRFTADDVDRLVRLQRKLLRRAAACVRPGGVLVYSVCTVSAPESEPILATLEGFELERTVRTRPTQPGLPDAFFAARLVRR
jgi:16S rRNA (cytosine967-C5)-methyltransferase